MPKASTVAGPMFRANITQFFRNGAAVVRHVLLPIRYEEAYNEMTAYGCCLAGEFLTNKSVVLSIMHGVRAFDSRVVPKPTSDTVQSATYELLAGWRFWEFYNWLRGHSKVCESCGKETGGVKPLTIPTFNGSIVIEVKWRQPFIERDGRVCKDCVNQAIVHFLEDRLPREGWSS